VAKRQQQVIIQNAKYAFLFPAVLRNHSHLKEKASITEMLYSQTFTFAHSKRPGFPSESKFRRLVLD